MTARTQRPRDRLLRDLITSGEAARLRKASGITQTTMAAGLGIGQPSLSGIENGWRRPGTALAARYLRVLRGLANHEAVSRELAAGTRDGIPGGGETHQAA